MRLCNCPKSVFTICLTTRRVCCRVGAGRTRVCPGSPIQLCALSDVIRNIGRCATLGRPRTDASVRNTAGPVRTMVSYRWAAFLAANVAACASVYLFGVASTSTQTYL
ncbi:hypothetical protein GCM10007977_001230 [Dactylosporangium sucinum]|uniref:Uncharacterized protein n=1 Tax=Dactylosporangium sucinum TaxID=1424081 RepID=A0A917SYD8_9ACTN|nr:hypothetical protein GCM10007977_001230 [Dactylosporangium sucinum]